MKTCNVSLLVRHPSRSLDELSSALGSHSAGSHSKGEPRGLEKKGTSPWSETEWRLDSGVSESAPVLDHLQDLNSRFPPADLLLRLPADSTVLIDIAVFFDTAIASVSIPRRGMEIVSSYNAALEITSYPSEFNAKGNS